MDRVGEHVVQNSVTAHPTVNPVRTGGPRGPRLSVSDVSPVIFARTGPYVRGTAVLEAPYIQNLRPHLPTIPASKWILYPPLNPSFDISKHVEAHLLAVASPCQTRGIRRIDLEGSAQSVVPLDTFVKGSSAKLSCELAPMQTQVSHFDESRLMYQLRRLYHSMCVHSVRC